MPLMPLHSTRQSTGNAARIGRLACIPLLLLTAAATIASAADDPGADSDRPRVLDAHARAVPPGQRNSAAFMRILNPGDQPRALVGAESPVARVVELHTHRMEDGVMKMRRVERIDLPAQGETALKPGGLHLMLIDLKQPLKQGDSVDLRIVLDNGEVIDVTADTRDIMPAHRMHHDGQAH